MIKKTIQLFLVTPAVLASFVPRVGCGAVPTANTEPAPSAATENHGVVDLVEPAEPAVRRDAGLPSSGFQNREFLNVARNR